MPLQEGEYGLLGWSGNAGALTFKKSAAVTVLD